MDHDQALAILKLLSDGNDPETGKAFPPDSPYQRPGVIRALFHAVGVLESALPVGTQPAGEARRCDPGAGSLPDSVAGFPLASAVPSPRRGTPAPRSGKPAEGGAVPAGEARRCDPGTGSLPDSVAGFPLASAVASPRRGAPAPRSGKPWTPEEDEKLVAGFDAGQTITALAASHGRSRIAIEARLARFGKVPMPAGVRGGNTPRASDIDRAHYATRT